MKVRVLEQKIRDLEKAGAPSNLANVMRSLSVAMSYNDKELMKSHLEEALATFTDYLVEIIDEADGDYGAFPRAASLGYRGVSSKSCKGLYKSLLNAARARAWNHREGLEG